MAGCSPGLDRHDGQRRPGQRSYGATAFAYIREFLIRGVGTDRQLRQRGMDAIFPKFHAARTAISSVRSPPLSSAQSQRSCDGGFANYRNLGAVAFRASSTRSRIRVELWPPRFFVPELLYANQVSVRDPVIESSEEFSPDILYHVFFK
jgi:hypothetical protein